MSQTVVELQPIGAVRHQDSQQQLTPKVDDGAVAETQPDGQQFSLPPVDHGKDAYLFLAACFVVEALVWGFPFSFGVFHNYYSTHPPFAGSSSIAIIGTCAMVNTSLLFLSLP
jgi:hypothetical protein